MLTRRGFSSFTACAICGITEFVATEAFAQGTQPAATPGVTRKILSQMDGPAPGYVTLLVEATIEAGVTIGRHTHPGIESAYVLEGGFELPIQGQPTRTIKPGDGFQIPPETPHAGASPAMQRPDCLLPTLSRRESHWRLLHNRGEHHSETWLSGFGHREWLGDVAHFPGSLLERSISPVF